MKALVIYYSQTGKTETIAEAIADGLKRGGADVRLEAIKPVEEKDYQTNVDEAKRGVKATIEPTVTDVKDYDIVCVGSPVWASAPAPSVNGYIASCTNLEGKKVVCFATHGGGGAESTIEQMKKMLEEKGATVVDSLSVSSTAPFTSEQLSSAQQLGEKLAKL